MVPLKVMVKKRRGSGMGITDAYGVPEENDNGSRIVDFCTVVVCG